MNLTDDQIRSLRELAEGVAHPGPWFFFTNRHPNTDGTPWGAVDYWRHPAGGAGRHVFTWSGYEFKRDAEFVAAANPAVVLSLVEEVQRLRDMLAPENAIGFEALAAKAEAGKGLLPFARHRSDCLVFEVRALRGPCDCGFDDALARWEAVENTEEDS